MEVQTTDQILRWVTSIGALVLSWPFVGLLVFVYLAFSRSALIRAERLFERVERLRLPGGLELLLRPNRLRGAASQLADAFQLYRADESRRLDRAVSPQQLQTELDHVTQRVAALKESRGLRCALYVPDPLFSDRLLQLTEYSPTQTNPGGKRGRTVSDRFGIVGLAWRSGMSQYEPHVSQAAETLVTRWGMYPNETRGREQQTALAVSLRTDVHALGVLYADSTDEAAFGDDKGLLFSEALRACAEEGIVTDLEKLARYLRRPLVAIA